MSKPSNRTLSIRLDDLDSLRTDDSHWRTEFDARPGREGQITQRYVGQPRRGRIPISEQDDRDLDFVINELFDARQMLRKAYAIDRDWQNSRSRTEAIKSAIAKIALATRMADLVVERRGGICGDCIDEDAP